MLAVNGTDEQFDYEEWARDWGVDEYGTDEANDSQAGDPPETLPENNNSQCSDQEAADGEENSREKCHWETDSRGSRGSRSVTHENGHGNEHAGGNARKASAGVSGSGAQTNSDCIRRDPLNRPETLGRREDEISGPNLSNCIELGQSLIAKSKSLDLNKRPTLSAPGESRTWVPPENRSHSPITSSSHSINQVDCVPSAINASSMSTSGEVQATMEIGKKLGFQFHGSDEQVKRVLKKHGVNNYSQ
ncbi:hypothetical protein L1887_35345 [Cichorium endivia]|nr:hypothetical protein L1887_35345 [Cichorium endivia]